MDVIRSRLLDAGCDRAIRLVLELYQLLRNPAVLAAPLSAPDAAAVCASWRDNPRWALIENGPVMDKVWAIARRPDIA